ncbi:hypothetical protein [Micromonospora sp. NPDC047074]|uniref:hypothetical protein n=1 Tax=Micromonospora sp. NPDC047074 TaxID=3154339 RepID=UPI0034095B0F
MRSVPRRVAWRWAWTVPAVPSPRLLFGLFGAGGRMIGFGFSGGAGWPGVPDEGAARRGIRVQRGVFGSPEEQVRAGAGGRGARRDENRTAVGKTLLTI